jgi:hypothetical protein
MSAPVVSGTIALMLQANPALTPNQVKAILQYTAEQRAGYDPLTQGAGFLNARGAVEAAVAAANGASTDTHADAAVWSRQIIWGNQRLRGDAIKALPAAGAWAVAVTWGASDVLDRLGEDTRGDNVVWGTTCGGANCEPASAGPEASAPDGVAHGTTAVEDVLWNPPAARRPRLEAVMDAAVP